ncbi:methyltransferase domain-containing protein [Streptomyces sp. ventii]|uniref:Protein-L-isoaspartate O-methyltransferase n=2 Tax=Streptomyces spiramenti TaxID=2720606 RepID=A0ABX1AHL0_9ACTN|nr:methyltransferase domain-containing protein [Streptomyces spiramenti]
MAERGLWPERAPWIRESMERLPRHAFAPDRLWRWDGAAYRPIERATEPDRWLAELYAGPHDPAVTQVESGVPSSSLSAPAVVADMLDTALLAPDRRVLELGTGCGWNAALLADRVGGENVVSVETDGPLAEAARRRLRDHAPAVRVVHGDGQVGSPEEGPFDRVVATYAPERVPWAWVAQTRPGGWIVTPWGRLGHVALRVAADGRSASGWFQGLAQFMPPRGTPASPPWPAAGPPPEPALPGTPLGRDPGPLLRDTDLLFALRAALPDIHITGRTGRGAGPAPDDGPAPPAAVRLYAPGGSYAVLDGPAGAVHRTGPRDLASEVAVAWSRWEERGSPSVYDHGLTVTADGERLWSAPGDEPCGV